jgi:hypothetical protein
MRAVYHINQIDVTKQYILYEAVFIPAMKRSR